MDLITASQAFVTTCSRRHTMYVKLLYHPGHRVCALPPTRSKPSRGPGFTNSRAGWKSSWTEDTPAANGGNDDVPVRVPMLGDNIICEGGKASPTSGPSSNCHRESWSSSETLIPSEDMSR